MTLPSEWVHRATRLQWSTNGHGDESCQATLDTTTDEAVAIIANNRADPVAIYGPLGEPLYQGRLDDPSLTLGEEGALSFASMGGWAALGDLEESYSALWSSTDYGDWYPLTSSDHASRNGDRYEIDTKGRLRIVPRKDESFVNTFSGGVGFAIPHNSRRQIVGIEFTFLQYAPTVPATWSGALATWNYDYTVFGATAWSLASTGGVQTGAVHLTLTPCDRLEFLFTYNGGAAAPSTSETGDIGIVISNVRIVTTTARRVNTTTTGAVVAGANQTISVANVGALVAGEYVIIGSGTTGERVLIESVGASSFVADLTLAHASGVAVAGHRVFGDEVADDVTDFVNSVNSTQLTASGLLSTMSLDLAHLSYEDTTPADILNDLCTKSGDGSVWETGVEAGTLHLRPRGQRARAWLIDVDAISLTTSLADVINSAYAIYENANGATIRSAVTADATSVIEYGITRRRSLGVQTSSATQAQSEIDALLDDKAVPGARTTIPNITALYDLYGTRWPLWEVNAGRGDTITIRNISPEVTSSLEARLTFRVSRTTYNKVEDTLTVELEAPRPGL